MLVIVPVNTIQNWRNEFNKWSPAEPPQHEQRDPDVDYRKLDVYSIDETSRVFEQKVLAFFFAKKKLLKVFGKYLKFKMIL